MPLMITLSKSANIIDIVTILTNDEATFLSSSKKSTFNRYLFHIDREGNRVEEIAAN